MSSCSPEEQAFRKDVADLARQILLARMRGTDDMPFYLNEPDEAVEELFGLAEAFIRRVNK